MVRKYPVQGICTATDRILPWLFLRFLIWQPAPAMRGTYQTWKNGFGRECCLKGYKTYFLRASELNQKLTDARKHGREGAVINGLVKPSCLIIDEIGRCVFDKENTRMFFDAIDRRYNKDGPSTMILPVTRHQTSGANISAKMIHCFVL